jgi:hypothetical protein
MDEESERQLTTYEKWAVIRNAAEQVLQVYANRSNARSIESENWEAPTVLDVRTGAASGEKMEGSLFVLLGWCRSSASNRAVHALSRSRFRSDIRAHGWRGPIGRDYGCDCSHRYDRLQQAVSSNGKQYQRIALAFCHETQFFLSERVAGCIKGPAVLPCSIRQHG